MDASLQKRLRSGDCTTRHNAIDELANADPAMVLNTLRHIASGGRRFLLWHYNFEDQSRAINALMNLKTNEAWLCLNKFFYLHVHSSQGALSWIANEADLGYPPATVDFTFPYATGELGRRLHRTETYEGGWGEGPYGEKPLTANSDVSAQQVRGNFLSKVPEKFLPTVSGHENIKWHGEMPRCVRWYLFPRAN